jgi:hypothetical protein
MERTKLRYSECMRYIRDFDLTQPKLKDRLEIREIIKDEVREEPEIELKKDEIKINIEK